jgi:hypothetical protein
MYFEWPIIIGGLIFEKCGFKVAHNIFHGEGKIKIKDVDFVGKNDVPWFDVKMNQFMLNQELNRLK